MATKTSGEDHLGVLDGIRGFLAFWVFLFHLEIACIGKSTPWGDGGVAVDIFMLLSGFLMAYHWLLREGKFESFQSRVEDFYVRRIFRIVPLYYLLLTVALILQSRLFQMGDYLAQIIPPPWASDKNYKIVHENLGVPNVLVHYLFVFGLMPKYAHSGILPDWSISLEMQFYFLFPWLMLCINRFGAFSLALFTAITAFATNKLIGLYLSDGILGNFPQPSFLPFKINVFMGGISIAQLIRNSSNMNGIFWAILTILSLFHTGIQVQIAALIIVMMLVFDNNKRDLFHRLASGRLARFFGDTSYSVYLVHILLYTPILYFLFNQQWYLHLNATLRLAVAFLLTAPLIYAVSYLLHRFVERPGINLGRSIFLRNRHDPSISAPQD